MEEQYRNIYVRGFFIPEYDEEKQDFSPIIEISSNINLLDEYLQNLRDIILFFFDSEQKINSPQDLRNFNDLFVMLNLSSLSKPWELLLNAWLEQKFGKTHDISIFLKNHFSIFSKTTKKFYKLFPADDRPGLNTSSLLIHLISTSSIATCLYVEENHIDNVQSAELQWIRTAAFFHDIGKPLSKRNHVQNSKILFKKYFEGVFSEELFANITNCISGHHTSSASGGVSYVRRGDILSSATDRLQEIAINVLSRKINNIENNFRNKDYWEKNENKLEELTQFFLEEYEEEIMKQQQQSEINLENFKKKNQLALIKGDVRDIHEYIDRVNTLTELRNSSAILDYNLTIQLVLSLLECENFCISPENILYSSGGNILLFSAGKNAQAISDYIESEFSQLTEGGLKLTADYLYFDQSYKQAFGDLYSKLAIKLGAKKNDLRHHKNLPFIFGSLKLCDSCKKNIALIPIDRGEDKNLYCKACAFKYELESNHQNLSSLSIQSKWNSIIEKSGFREPIQWSDISNYIMEFIAGVPYREIKRIMNDSRGNSNKNLPQNKLVVINADGNLIGEFIAKSITISDLYSRIIHTSNTMIEIFEDILEQLKNMEKNEDILRLLLGKIYIGGDDILLLTPAYLAIPISLSLILSFYKKMGAQCTLSVGMFLCGPKFPIWNAIETASKLLENAKKIGRLQNNGCRSKEKKIGAIDFQSEFIGTHIPNLDYYSRITGRPYKILLERNNDLSISDFQSFITNIISPEYPMDQQLKENYENLYNFIYEELNKMNNNRTNSVLKELRNLAKKLQAFFPYNIEDFTINKKKAISYILYQTGRLERQELYLKIFRLIGRHNFKTDPVLISDLLEIIRFLSGGLL